jgi:hypothetical protein
MTNKFTSDDLIYIDWLKEALNNTDYIASFNKKKNTFSWRYFDKGEENSKKNCKTQMIDAFMSDLLNGTKTHRYDLYNHYQKEVRQIIDKLTIGDDKKLSQDLKLSMLELFEGSDEVLLAVLDSAYRKLDGEFMLTIFEKAMFYNDFNDDLKGSIPSVVTLYYRRLIDMGQIDIEKIQHSFINRLKHSTITHEADLIKLYLNLFEQKDLSLLTDTFNIQAEEICLKTEANAYSRLTLSLKGLAILDLNESQINNLSETLQEHQIDFPLFYSNGHQNNELYVLFESGEKNSQKMNMLFTQLMSQKYKFRIDYDNHYESFLELVSKINEQVHLDSVIGDGIIKPKIKV